MKGVNYINYLLSNEKKFYKSIRDIIGFYPSNIRVFKTALRHRSASFANPNGFTVNNERLEYLGDAILGSIVAEFLYKKYPTEDEGFLTQMRSKMVNGVRLAQLAKDLGLDHLIVANINHNGQKTKNIYGDAFEAIIGAIYIDKGYRKTKKFVINHILKNFFDLTELKDENLNFKSQLIEWGQQYKKEIEFQTDSESKKSLGFISHVKVDNKEYGTGRGRSKKAAEQNAAQASLKLINKKETTKNE